MKGDQGIAAIVDGTSGNGIAVCRLATAEIPARTAEGYRSPPLSSLWGILPIAVQVCKLHVMVPSRRIEGRNVTAAHRLVKQHCPEVSGCRAPLNSSLCICKGGGGGGFFPNSATSFHTSRFSLQGGMLWSLKRDQPLQFKQRPKHAFNTSLNICGHLSVWL